MKTALCKADRQPTRIGVSKAPLDIRRKVDTGCRHSGRHDHCDKRLKGRRPVRWVIETCEVLCRESTLQSVRIQTRCDSGRDDGMDRLDHRSNSPLTILRQQNNPYVPIVGEVELRDGNDLVESYRV